MTPSRTASRDAGRNYAGPRTKIDLLQNLYHSNGDPQRAVSQITPFVFDRLMQLLSQALPVEQTLQPIATDCGTAPRRLKRSVTERRAASPMAP